MWELDWALEEAPGGALNDAFLVFLAGAIAVRNQLSLPFQEVLSFWIPLETRDVTNHLGDEDAVQPSTYTEVFRNPAVLASAGNIFVPVSTSIVTAASDSTPIAITTAAPHAYQTNQSVTITGVVGNTAANGTFQITVVTAHHVHAQRLRRQRRLDQRRHSHRHSLRQTHPRFGQRHAHRRAERHHRRARPQRR